MDRSWTALYGMACDLLHVGAFRDIEALAAYRTMKAPSFEATEACRTAHNELRWQEAEATRMAEQWANMDYRAARLAGAR